MIQCYPDEEELSEEYSNSQSEITAVKIPGKITSGKAMFDDKAVSMIMKGKKLYKKHTEQREIQSGVAN